MDAWGIYVQKYFESLMIVGPLQIQAELLDWLTTIVRAKPLKSWKHLGEIESITEDDATQVSGIE